MLCHISSYHSGIAGDLSLLEREALSLAEWLPVFRRHHVISKRRLDPA